MLTKTSKAIRLATLGLATAGAFTFAQTASAEVEVAGSVSIANMYLWRGIDLGNGSGAISGDIVVSTAGAYAGIWGSSGDSAAGTEYDLFVGYGMEAGDFSLDISVWNYIYPSSSPEEDNILDDFGGLSEVILSLGFGPFSASYYDNVAGGTGYEYYTVGAELGSFGATVGHHSGEGDADDMTHLDLSYAYNDNLSFVVSQVVDTEEDDTYDEDLKFVVSYSLPLN